MKGEEENGGRKNVRASERWWKRGTETPIMLCFPPYLSPPLHDPSISGDTLVPAGQSGLALLFVQNEGWTFPPLPRSQRTDKWQVEEITQADSVRLFCKCQCIWWTPSLHLLWINGPSKYPNKCHRDYLHGYSDNSLEPLTYKAQEGAFPLVYVSLPFLALPFKYSLKEIHCALEDKRRVEKRIFLCLSWTCALKRIKTTSGSLPH